MGKVAEILTNSQNELARKTQILLLKCLVNSCVEKFKYKSLNLKENEISKYQTKFYGLLSNEENLEKIAKIYPIETHFPYDGISEWTIDNILQLNKKMEKLSDEELDIMTQCIQFLSNFVSLACKNISASYLEDPPSHIENEEFKNAIS